MRISDVSLDDGRVLANLINFLKAGRWDLSGDDVDKLMAVRKLVHEIATQAAAQLKPAQKSPEPTPDSSVDSGMKIKAMGPIGSTPKKPKKK